ncbi:MAG: hypothetical protein H5T69_13830 [Chloroflexi bacterium]|nr:hypothetical protein [Chloroflexota bacterium]
MWRPCISVWVMLAMVVVVLSACVPIEAKMGRWPEGPSTRTLGRTIPVGGPNDVGGAGDGTPPPTEGATSNSSAGQLPGAGPHEGEETEELSDTATWLTYTNREYRFRLSYPPHLVIETLDERMLATLDPSPVAGVDFRDPRGDVAAIAPPAFSVRVFENGERLSLEEWLRAHQLFRPQAGWVSEPVTLAHVSGLKIVSSTLMAPGWWIYVARGEHIFQLTPLGQEAERMLDTFAFE